MPPLTFFQGKIQIFLTWESGPEHFPQAGSLANKAPGPSGVPGPSSPLQSQCDERVSRVGTSALRSLSERSAMANYGDTQWKSGGSLCGLIVRGCSAAQNALLPRDGKEREPQFAMPSGTPRDAPNTQVSQRCFLKTAGSLPHGRAHVTCLCSAQDKARLNMPSSQLNNLSLVISPEGHCSEITQFVICPSECD